MEAERIRVLLVDDSPFIRRAVERMLRAVPGMEVVGAASNGREGVERVRELRPDVVILDIVMPELDGLDAIREIMATVPTPILVLSTQTRPGAEVTLKALELGAVDFVSKTQAGTRMDIYDLAPVLREKVLAAAGSRLPPSLETSPPTEVQPSGDVLPATSPYDVLVIGASTGGPRAIASLLAALPADFPAGVLVAQHMPPGFTGPLAQRLDRRSAMEVREARDGDPIEPGLVLLGVGGRQLRIEREADRLVARVPALSEGLLYRPSVDLLFASAAEVVGARTVGVVLTGMGVDGAVGLEAIRAAGGRTLIESESSAVIYGMPRAARAFAEKAVQIDALPATILDLFRGDA